MTQHDVEITAKHQTAQQAAPQRALEALLDRLTSQNGYLSKVSQRLSGLARRLDGAECGCVEKQNETPVCGLMQQLRDAVSESESLIAALDSEVSQLEEVA